MKYFVIFNKTLHIIAPIYHMFCVSHFGINMNFSKCVDFA
jgi:hypothetical protein